LKAIKKQGEPAALKDWKRGMQHGAPEAVRPRGMDAAVQGTIDRVQLCHDRLCELRRSAAQAWGLVLSPRGMRSRRQLKSAAEARLEPFCVALSQVALKYAEQEEKRSQRVRPGHGGKAGE
jgi:hypothetical protein